MPFENSVDIFELRGDHLKEVFEHAVEGEWRTYGLRYLTHVSGTSIETK